MKETYEVLHVQQSVTNARSIISQHNHPLLARLHNCEKPLLTSSCLSVRMEQLSSHWTDFHEI
jgi:hypothetical protein